MKTHLLPLLILFAAGSCSSLDRLSLPAAPESRPDGAIRLTVAEDDASDQNPAFSPKGSTLLFTRFEAGYNRGPATLYLLNLESGALRPLTAMPDSDNVNLPGSAWNSTTGRIVFSSDREDIDEIWSIADDGSHPFRVTFHDPPFHFIEPSFSPDGEWIVFEMNYDAPDDSGQGSIWIVQADGSRLTQLTDGPRQTTDDRQPNWSPDGDHILFQRRDPGSDNWDMFTIRPDGGDLRQVTAGLSSDTDASWSPDGRWIVYSTDYGGLPVPNIFILPAEGGTPLRITFDDEYEDGAPSWSPDGRWIAFESHIGQDEDAPASLWWIAAKLPPDFGSAK